MIISTFQEPHVHYRAIELLEKSFNTKLIVDSVSKPVYYKHPKWIPRKYFEPLRDHIPGEEFKKIAHYGDRFLGQFILGNHPEKFYGESWEPVVKRLSFLQKKFNIQKDKTELYQEYRKAFQKQVVYEVIDPIYLSLAVKELSPEFVVYNHMTLADAGFRYDFFHKDFSSDKQKRHIQFILQKYYLKKFLTFIATH